MKTFYVGHRKYRLDPDLDAALTEDADRHIDNLLTDLHCEWEAENADAFRRQWGHLVNAVRCAQWKGLIPLQRCDLASLFSRLIPSDRDDLSDEKYQAFLRFALPEAPPLAFGSTPAESIEKSGREGNDNGL